MNGAAPQLRSAWAVPGKGPLVIASHNEGKVREIGELLAPLGLQAAAAAGLGLPEPEETGASFAANAGLKARAAAQNSQLPALADDSGLVIPALDGAPGIYSARWAGPGKDFRAAFARIEAELTARNAPLDSPAHFICALCLAVPDGESYAFEGRVDGALCFPPRGGYGFGYDPVFIPVGHHLTFGEMSPAIKHIFSHRAMALAKCVEFLKTVL